MNEQARRNWEQPIEIVEVSEEIQRYLAHRERSRFMRFYKACGWMSVVQCVVVAAALVLFLVVGLMAGDYAIVLGTVVLPALVGFSLRGVLIRYLRMTRIMWKTTFFLFIGLFVFKSQIPQIGRAHV